MSPATSSWAVILAVIIILAGLIAHKAHILL
ncbi:hypothetical protein X764_13765 [Mesorhizobium sp. LSHC440A00]|nr:hypothetical protein X764_13765 [Mesorhizobium sp. LSHC440A00]